MEVIAKYCYEALEELRHVRWPTRVQAIRLSSIVLGFTIFSALLFGFVDYLFAQLIQFLFSFI